MKQECTSCRTVKASSEFRASPKAGGRCRPCETRLTAQWRKANPQLAHGLDLAQRGYWPGLSAAEARKAWETLFKAQRGRCAICRKPQKDVPIRFAVDHDHATGRVRGLLCRTCNLALVYFDNEVLRAAALSYIAPNPESPRGKSNP